MKRQELSSITLHMAFISFTPLSLLLIAAAISIDVAGSFIIASYNYPSLPRIASGSFPFIHSSTSSSSTTAYHPYSYLTSYCALIQALSRIVFLVSMSWLNVLRVSLIRVWWSLNLSFGWSNSIASLTLFIMWWLDLYGFFWVLSHFIGFPLKS